MLVDAFLFNDEVSLAELRISFLSHKIDKFFVGESTQTFSNKNKLKIFELWMADGKLGDLEIEIISIPEYEASNSKISRWEIEEYQRNFFLREIRQRLEPSDVVFFCDVDEIPSYSQIERNASGVSQPLSLLMPCYYRRANWRVLGNNSNWQKAKVFEARHARDGIRYENCQISPGNPGIHISYLNFDHKTLREKYSSFSHQELDDPRASSRTFLDFCDLYGINHTGWANSHGLGLLRSESVQPSDNFQYFLLKSKQDSFDFREFKGSLLTRLVAASYVSRYLRNFNGKYEAALKTTVISKLTLNFWFNFLLVLKTLFNLYCWDRLKDLLRPLKNHFRDRS